MCFNMKKTVQRIGSGSVKSTCLQQFQQPWNGGIVIFRVPARTKGNGSVRTFQWNIDQGRLIKMLAFSGKDGNAYTGFYQKKDFFHSGQIFNL